ncbi:MAG TPA: hypothetical protein VFW02_06245, partial [Candidatus Limnocylindrales bacterium]|nr:hypothetical protein [Candidatus Limnocylindrales bacterium]
MSIETFESILRRMLGPRVEGRALPIFDPEPWLDIADGGEAALDADAAELDGDGASLDDGEVPGATNTAALTGAFLVALCGPAHPSFERAMRLLHDPSFDEPDGLAALYRRGLMLVRDEIVRVAATEADMAARLASVAERLDGPRGGDDAEGHVPWDEASVSEVLWSVFFPEGVGIRGREAEREAALRAARTVTVSSLSPNPIHDPGRELLFTSNVLLTTPSPSRPIAELPYPPDLRRDLEHATVSPQAFWY